MGGECEILAVGVPDAALADAETWVHVMQDRLTRFDEGSELSRFNASAGRWVEVSEELAALLREHDGEDGVVAGRRFTQARDGVLQERDVAVRRVAGQAEAALGVAQAQRQPRTLFHFCF